MRIPALRYRIRTLMIAVAVAGITLWVVILFPATCYGIALLGALLIILVIGASCGGYYSANRFAGCIVGGMIGAIAQSILLMAWLEHDSSESKDFGWEIFVLVAGTFALGKIAGLLVGILLDRAWSQ